MKQLYYFLLLLIIPFTAKAQITLEHTFSMKSEINSDPHELFGDIFDVTWGDPTKGYYIINTLNNEVTIYDIDYSITKTFTAPTVEGLDLSTIYIASTYAFNADDKVEFIINYGKYVNRRLKNAVVVCDDDGQILHQFTDARLAWFFKTPDDALKLKVSKTVYDDISDTEYYCTNQYEIYKLPGHISTSNAQLKSTSVDPAYPNPARQTVNLPYHLENGQTATMRIFSINGELMEQKQIDGHFDKIVLNVSPYQPGQYIYEYNGKSNRFTVR